MRPDGTGDCTVGPMTALVDPSSRRPAGTRARRARSPPASCRRSRPSPRRVERAIEVQPAAQLLHRHLGRRGDGGGRRGRAGAVRGDAARRAARRARRRQGHHAGRRPPHDVRVARLRALGARRTTPTSSAPCAAPGPIIIGQTTTPEFAHTLRTDSPLWGVTRNPHDPRARRAARRAAAGRRWRRAACRSPRAATWAARCASRRRGAASSGSSRGSGGSRWTCCRVCSTRSPTTARWPAAPTTPGCSSPPRRVPTTPTSCRSPARSTSPHRSTPTSPACASGCPSTSAAGPSTRRSPPPSRRRPTRLEAAGATSRRSTRRSPAPTRRRGACCGPCSWPTYYGHLLDEFGDRHGPRGRRA